MSFFYCPSMAYKEMLSQDTQTFICIKEGIVSCFPFNLWVDPGKGQTFLQSMDWSYFYFYLWKYRHKMYLMHILYKISFILNIIYYPYMFDKWMGSNKAINHDIVFRTFFVFSVGRFWSYQNLVQNASINYIRSTSFT